MKHWLWSAAHREYYLVSGPGTRLRTSGDRMALVPFAALDVLILTADELDDAAAIARRYRDTGVFGPEGGERG